MDAVCPPGRGRYRLLGGNRDVASVRVVGWGDELIGEREADVADTDAVATTTIAVHRGAWSDPDLAPP